jgi:hypothetical protein
MYNYFDTFDWYYCFIFLKSNYYDHKILFKLKNSEGFYERVICVAGIKALNEKLFVNHPVYKASFALQAFGFLITNVKILFQKLTFFSYAPPHSFSILSLLFHISFIHLHSYFSPFLSLPLSLSHFATSIPHVLNCLFLSPHSTFCTFFPLLPYITRVSSPRSHI